MPFKFKPQKRFCFFQLKRFAEKLNTVNNDKKNLNEIMVMKSEPNRKIIQSFCFISSGGSFNIN